MDRFPREPFSARNAVTVIVISFVIVVASGIAMRATDHREYSSVGESHARTSVA